MNLLQRWYYKYLTKRMDKRVLKEIKKRKHIRFYQCKNKEIS